MQSPLFLRNLISKCLKQLWQLIRNSLNYPHIKYNYERYKHTLQTVNQITLIKSLVVVIVSFSLCILYFQTHMGPLLDSKDKAIITVVITFHNINAVSIIQAIMWNICTYY
jgi:hypothetical protein